LEQPAWASGRGRRERCTTCDVGPRPGQPRGLAILLRDLRLCRYPFTVSAGVPWQQMRNEYLYTLREIKAGRAGWTEYAANAPNGNKEKLPRFSTFLETACESLTTHVCGSSLFSCLCTSTRRMTSRFVLGTPDISY
jgi:hypothetical protein